ncbi:MAG: MBL fold metallo-hydrolase [Solirubrobacteraceae bacterium]
MTAQVQLDSAISGLHASSPETLPFAPSLEIRSFVLRRAHGNLLIYGSRGLAVDAQAIEDLGGISRHYLNHRHEATFAPEGLTTPLFCHERERSAVETHLAVRATFSRRHTLDDDFEVIPAPGHTSGATAFLWDSGEHRVLFTGDSVYLDDGEWVAAVLDSSERTAYLTSLELSRGLEFDVLVPWAATAGQPYLAATSRAEAERRLDAMIARVARGEAR